MVLFDTNSESKLWALIVLIWCHTFILSQHLHKIFWKGSMPDQLVFYVMMRVSWPNGQHSCFIFGRSQVQILVHRLAILTEVFHGFP
jgi:hypothetical protein